MARRKARATYAVNKGGCRAIHVGGSSRCLCKRKSGKVRFTKNANCGIHRKRK